MTIVVKLRTSTIAIETENQIVVQVNREPRCQKYASKRDAEVAILLLRNYLSDPVNYCNFVCLFLFEGMALIVATKKCFRLLLLWNYFYV